MDDAVLLWTVYGPEEPGGDALAQIFMVDGNGVTPTRIVIIDPLEAIRAQFLKQGLVCCPRQDGDEPEIVESWLL